MNRHSKRKQTKQLLLDSTKKLVREKGCNKTTLKDIMELSGLSKGAIYHYVKSKDELLVLVLQDRLEDINRRFFSAVENGEQELERPLHEIADSLPALQEPDNITNRIFIYLLGQNDQSDVKEVLRRYYEQAIQMSKQWIISGQQNGVIPLSIDAEKTADLFLLISYGFRMRSAVQAESAAFNAADFSKFMADMLQPHK